MVELVEKDGWIDESKFGLKVVGHNFRNWRGIFGLIPLGLRMVWKGKMPYPWQFERSPAVAELQRIITKVLRRPSSPETSPPTPHSQDCQ
jgi:succinate dehydrogenase / fumarate reductase iron-sulfur subunit